MAAIDNSQRGFLAEAKENARLLDEDVDGGAQLGARARRVVDGMTLETPEGLYAGLRG